MPTDNDKRRERAEVAAAGERPPSRYAILVVVEVASTEPAWDAVQGAAGALEGDGEPDCVYVGALWRGIPADAEDLGTESIRFDMSLPDRDGDRFVAATRELRPCE
jgi:hypothetical protein